MAWEASHHIRLRAGPFECHDRIGSGGNVARFGKFGRREAQTDLDKNVSHAPYLPRSYTPHTDMGGVFDAPTQLRVVVGSRESVFFSCKGSHTREE